MKKETGRQIERKREIDKISRQVAHFISDRANQTMASARLDIGSRQPLDLIKLTAILRIPAIERME